MALCTHNGSSHLREQLESIRTQSQVPAEIVISDDLSTDSTLTLVEEVTQSWGADDPAVTVLVHESNVGVSANFERAIRSTTGDIVFLCDQDDVWHPEKVATIIREFTTKEGVLLVHSNARLVSDQGLPWKKSLFENLGVSRHERATLNSPRAYTILMKRNLITGATAAVRRDFALQAMPFPRVWIHDEWLGLCASALGRISCINLELIDYRQHSANVIGVTRFTLVYLIKYLFASRGKHLVTLVERTTVLLQRSDVVPPGSSLHGVAQEKLAFEQDRVRYSRIRTLRLRAIVRNVGVGNYRKFASKGLLDALRDLTQAA